MTVLAALGGSTNAVVHLLALAGRVRVDLVLDDFDRVSARTPVLVNVEPVGELLVKDLDAAGGVPALMGVLREQLALDAPTVTGPPVGELLAEPSDPDRDVIAPLERPVKPAGGLMVLRGNLAPRGALLKRAAADPALAVHSGPAVVFDSIEELAETIDDPALEIGAESVLVLRNAGPVGAPGMPEWGMLPIPRRMLKAGVADMVRISDARMSGTGFGTNVLHVVPEAAVGGPLAAVRTGDTISLDAGARSLRLEISDEELAARLAARPQPDRTTQRGYVSLYRDHVLQADEGCDFDFLRGHDCSVPRGLDIKWIAGW
jgi:dihydroxy-acid dehydratase